MDLCDVPFETLVDLEDGRLDVAEATQIQLHAAPCRACSRSLAWLRVTLPRVRAVLAREEPHPSASAVAYARSLARRIPVARPDPFLALRIARPVFDSRQSAPVGARREAPAPVQRLFETDVYVIDLWEEAEASGPVYLIGQAHVRVDGTVAAPDGVAGIDASGAVWPARLEGAEFHFPALVPGRYQLRLSLPTEEVLLIDVEIGG